MKLIKSMVLFDGTTEKRNCYIGFEWGDRILYVGEEKSKSDYSCKLIAQDVFVTLAIIDANSHIGMVRSGEPACEDEANEHSNAILPLINSLRSIYMDDLSFRDSVESGVLYSVILPGSGNIIDGKAVLL